MNKTAKKVISEKLFYYFMLFILLFVLEYYGFISLSIQNTIFTLFLTFIFGSFVIAFYEDYLERKEIKKMIYKAIEDKGMKIKEYKRDGDNIEVVLEDKEEDNNETSVSDQSDEANK